MSGLTPKILKEGQKALRADIKKSQARAQECDALLVDLTQEEREQFEARFREHFLSGLLKKLAASAIESGKGKPIEIGKNLVLFQAILKMEFESADNERTMNLTHLIRSVARISFDAGKVSDKELEDIAAEAQRQHVQRLSEKSLETRQAKAAEWHARALKLMQASRVENPAGTYDDLADYVLHNWRAGKKPGRDNLKRQAATWIKKGELSAKAKTI